MDIVLEKMPMPAMAISTETTRPITPSVCQPNNLVRSKETSTAVVLATSEMASVEVANSNLELQVLPSLRLNKNIQNLTKMERDNATTVSTNVGPCISVCCGWKILLTLSVPNSNANTNTKKATIMLATYSNLWWPQGCSLSAGLPANLKLMRETTLLAQSVRLFSPSASTEITPKNAPATILQVAKRKLSKMPKVLANLPTDSLVLLLVVS